MLHVLLCFRSEIGQVLGLIACTITVIYFEYVFGWSWYIATPVGVPAFVSMLTLSGRLIAYGSTITLKIINSSKILDVKFSAFPSF